VVVGDGPALPSGVVAFLFSDIEGSTALLHRLGPAYASHLQQYRVLLTESFARHGGVLLGSEGDSLFVGFERVSGALRGAVDGQLALGQHHWPDNEPVKARMGVHVGEVERLGEGYVGMPIHVTARVCAAAHGGQILTTDDAHRLTPEIPVLDLGEHTLKDVGRMRLLQVRDAALPAQFPPLRATSAHPSNLPASQDEFIGRTAELGLARAALDEARLVTLTGPGGAGKTRLAVEIGQAVLASFRDGVWFVPLASASTGDRIIPLMATALHVGERAGEALNVTLEAWLHERQVLVVLDNCEHLVEAVSEFAAQFLEACPQMRILATSREILGVRAERALRVPPLGMSEETGVAGPSEAVDLLLTRAQSMVPDFEAEKADRQVALQVCRRLDGLPLAIELAAARMRALSLEQLETRLNDRFRLLTGGSRTDLPRHQTLQAVVAWSYDLLEEAEQHVFRRLSVFAGDVSLDAAETVVSGPPVMEDDVLDVLTRLVEKSLVTISPGAGGYRYRLLETLRQYGSDRLLESGEAALWRTRLLDWTMKLVSAVEETLRTPRQDAAIGRAIPEQASLRVALSWARELGDTVTALRIVSAVPIGPISERRELLISLLAQVADEGKLDDAVAGRAWSALANIALEQSDWAFGIDAAQKATICLGRARLQLQEAWAQLLEAWLHWGAGDLLAVDEKVDRIASQFRELGDDFGLGYTLWIASLRAADLERATAMAAEADSLLRRSGSPVGIAHNVEGRAIIAYDRRQLKTAAGFAIEAITLFSGSINYGCTAHALEVAAVVVAAGGGASEGLAAELLSAAQMLREESGQGHRPWEVRARHGDIDNLGSTAAPAAAAAGRRHTLASAASVAIRALQDIRDTDMAR
jgi:predicted ATPase/class 3 adenylate cyclase